MMTFDRYQEEARTFRLPTADENYVLMNLVAELGEFFGHIAKATRDETQLEATKLLKELGDMLWHISSLCDDMGVELSSVAEMNIEKLKSRQVRGTITGSGDER